MAFSKVLFASLLLSILLLHITQAQPMGGDGAQSPLPQTIDCEAACEGRCTDSSRPNLCKRACESCCKVCKCVPPGTYGNEDACPCYARLTTHDNMHKCP